MFVDWIKSLPADQRPKTAAYPTQDDPFAAPVIETMQKQLEAARRPDRVQLDLPRRHHQLPDHREPMAAKKPDLIAQGAVFEDGVGLIRSLKQLNYSPKMLFQTSAPSNAAQYSDGVGVANTEGVFYTVSWHDQDHDPARTRSSWPATRSCTTTPSRPRTPPTPSPRPRCWPPASPAVGTLDQQKLRDWLHANTVETILGPLKWDETGAPQGQFLLAQWQGGKVQIVAPADGRHVDDGRQPQARLEVIRR